jgi:hypothetical protein
VPPAAADPSATEDKSPTGVQVIKRLPQKDQAMEGQPASGGGSNASTSQNANQATGFASSQRTPPKSKPPQTQNPDEPDDEQKTAAKKPPRRKKDGGQLSNDANSGQGKSAMPSSSPNSLQAPEEPDKTGPGNQPDVADEGSEDEDEQEKSASVATPRSDNKKPSVDRNLSNQPNGPPNDQANGRSGPGALKKTRGVPTLILGVPLPDRVPGTPNPGRSQVTQEYTRPKEESHPEVEALAQTPRDGAVGHVEQADMAPWRRALVETYFETIRQQNQTQSNPNNP